MHDRLPSFLGIEAFLTTAETLNLRLSSKSLNISVSAVSRRIATLEEEIGAQLFIRGSRKLALTPAGLRYRDQLRPSVEMMRHATNAIGSRESQDLTILATPSFLAGWLAPRLGGFLSQYRGTRITFTTLRKRKLGHSDVVVEPRFHEDGSPEVNKLFSWISTPVCRQDVLDGHGICKPDDLDRAFLIDLAAPVSGWSKWFEAAGLPEARMTKWLKFDSFLLMMNAASNGLGVALTTFFQRSIDRTLVCPFEIASRLPGGMYVQQPTGYERAIVRLFREWLMDEVESCRREVPHWARSMTGTDY